MEFKPAILGLEYTLTLLHASPGEYAAPSLEPPPNAEAFRVWGFRGLGFWGFSGLGLGLRAYC